MGWKTTASNKHLGKQRGKGSKKKRETEKGKRQTESERTESDK